MMRAAVIAIAIAAWAHVGAASPRIAIIEGHIHPMASRPELYVAIESATDVSSSVAATRRAHTDLVRNALTGGLASTPQLTTVASEARRFHLDGRRIDISVVRLDDEDGAITAEVRAMISDDSGKMLAVVSSSARVDVTRRMHPGAREALRDQALRDAAQDLSSRVRRRLVPR